MDTFIPSNDWIRLTETRKGAPVERKYAGINTLCDMDNKVLNCTISYWEREVYPNGEMSKSFLKTYSLQDLEKVEFKQDEVLKYRDQLLVLTGFINNLGQPAIVNPVRDTLDNTDILPLEHEENYPLRRDTRPILNV